MLDFQLPANPANQAPMAKYMLNQFPFLGLKTPVRRAKTKPLLAVSKNWANSHVMAAVAELYGRPQREYQYAAIELARAHVHSYGQRELATLSQYVMQKSWWDTVDALRPIFGDYVNLHPASLPDVYAMFAEHENFWMRRVAITLQLASKGATNTELLTRAIDYDLHTDEFFIQKAIGWALRQYSKTDAAWVAAFIASRPDLSKLAVREGSKYLVK
ncbi:DNA alkylation repair protein [Lacticaseibacillus sharpeae]|uniref:DNA alkylation repair protein n=1 Tax=Lacticaseibacillus sharpeae JCM 1186 = DSM 20505 TaxID=1291052 RepID=A0A0R1ZLZ3_9LACO|nr:DNA alkylation repair protein [Lacticaseibacillus sharpeae]KRM55434.1 DNA alkylation repair protein [Lacticaseibacillus sharpeae JCM 1186 = DSM 20505]